MPSRIGRRNEFGDLIKGWSPYRRSDGLLSLGLGRSSTDAKLAANQVSVATEEEAIELLLTGPYWIRITKDGKAGNLVSPENVSIDGMSIQEFLRKRNAQAAAKRQ